MQNQRYAPPLTSAVCGSSVEPAGRPCSLLESMVNTADSHKSRLKATLQQLYQVEDSLIGCPVCETGSSKADAKKSTPLLIELRDTQEEITQILSEIGFVLDRISDAVRK